MGRLLELMARQTTLTKMQVFIAGIVTFVIFVIISLIFMALLVAVQPW